MSHDFVLVYEWLVHESGLLFFQVVIDLTLPREFNPNATLLFLLLSGCGIQLELFHELPFDPLAPTLHSI